MSARARRYVALLPDGRTRRFYTQAGAFAWGAANAPQGGVLVYVAGAR